ncbi:FHA domain-containing protein [Arthrobacter sp. AQ5-05]|uniref:FHA domain-containing protein n=1 Tax=Arthrobacter sp. AQ5-05 TaxID=2184581 RepID=UPI0012B5EC29|nr:FHA domain-containing protein [Arthrobacter sp. AQ5-05]
MNNTTYRTGPWLGIVRSGSVIVLEAGTDPATVTALWDYLGAQTPSIHGVLNAVTARFGTELTGMPQFAILVHTERLHVILRGEMSLIADTAGHADAMSGREVTTWSERSLQLPDSWTLTLGAAVDSAGEVPAATLTLPLGEAVVYLGEMSRGTAATQASTQGGLGLPVAVVPVPPHTPPVGLPEVASVADLAAGAFAEPDAELGADFPPMVFDAGEGLSFDEPLDMDAIYADHAPQDGADAYAGFALAADAEWSAQLGDPTGGQPAVEGTDHTHRETDMGLTIFPDHGPEEDSAYADPDEVQEGLAGEGAHANPVVDGAADDLGEPGGHDGDQRSVSESSAGEDSADDDSAGEESADADSADHDSAGEDSVDLLGADRNAPGAGEPDVDGFTTNYDHLFGATEVRSVEDAAVRLDENGHELPKEEPGVVPPMPPMPPAVGNYAGLPVAGDAAVREGQDADTELPWQPPSGVLIDSVPWGSADTPASSGEPGTGFPGENPDHDGYTLMRGDLPDALPDTPATGQQAQARPSAGPMVLARLCPQGHANPPSRALCSDCGAAINSEPREVGRPRLGRMHVSTGEVLDLDHSLIIGRQPSVSRVQGGVMPRLVQVHSASGDISRSHVEVRLDGWEVLLVDLQATNGTVLVREGQAPRRLGQGEQAILLNGDIAELGDGVSLLFEGLL